MPSPPPPFPTRPSPAGWGLLAGTVADWVVGDPRRWHPVAGFGAAASALERRCWRESRAAGAAYAGVLVGGAAGAAALAGRWARGRPAAAGCCWPC